MDLDIGQVITLEGGIRLRTTIRIHVRSSAPCPSTFLIITNIFIVNANVHQQLPYFGEIFSFVRTYSSHFPHFRVAYILLMVPQVQNSPQNLMPESSFLEIYEKKIGMRPMIQVE